MLSSGAVHQHWRSMRDDATRKTTGKYDEHRAQVKRLNRLKKVSIFYNFDEVESKMHLFLYCERFVSGVIYFVSGLSIDRLGEGLNRAVADND